MNVLFAKASNERDARFRIVTKICENEDGVRTVVKTPCCIEARRHICRIHENCKKLSEFYQNSELAITSCEIRGQDAVFQFISGISLDEMLYRLILARDRDGFLTLFRRFLRLITENVEFVEFKKSTGFQRVFGEVSIPKGIPALPFADIDMIPSNIIVDTDGGWNLIDYEWVFDFPVPVDYIAYRAVWVFRFNHDLQGLFSELELYSALGIDQGLIDEFRIMDKGFMQYVTNESDGNGRYSSLLENSLTVSDLLAESKEAKEKREALQDQIITLQNKNDELSVDNREQNKKIIELDSLLNELRDENDELTIHNEEQNDIITELNRQLAERQNQLSVIQEQYLVKCADYDAINGAFFWQITGPIRNLLIKLKHLFRNSTAAHKIWHSIKRIVRPKSQQLDRSGSDSIAVPSDKTSLIDRDNLIGTKAYSPSDNIYSLLEGKFIDVILPVYNGRTILPPLLKSIQRTSVPYRLIIVDDKSSDEQILLMLREYASIRDNVLLLENEINMGYTRSINKALRLSHSHVVLLNSDVRLPEYWLERLIAPILMDETVCSATPFTNSGTICSFPDFCQDNDLYLDLSVDEIDAVFGRLKPCYMRIPTGVGFCMALSRTALDRIGLYDEESFTRGYGEENDWCRRAEEAGFHNVMVENLFVYHQHGATFTSDEKKKLIEQNLQILSEKHPDYSSCVQQYIREDPVSVYRDIASLMLFANGPDPVLAFDHDWGGGATYFLNRRIKELSASGQTVIVIRYSTERGYVLTRKIGGLDRSICASSLEWLFQLLPDRLQSIWVNELVSYPKLATTMHLILDLAKKRGAEIRFFLHDYYCICPNYKLLNEDGVFCGVCEPKECAQSCKPHGDMTGWRRKWERFLSQCDEIIVFSEDSWNNLHRCYPALENIKVIPHDVAPLRMVCRNPRKDTLNIGVIGAISVEKGLKIIEEMAALIQARQLPVHISIIGYTAYELSDRETISVTGKYQRDDLPDILEENQVDIILIPSIWPETFSFTISEAMYMGLPVACFNIGAPVERVSKYDKGLIIPEITAESALNSIYSYWKSELSKAED